MVMGAAFVLMAGCAAGGQARSEPPGPTPSPTGTGKTCGGTPVITGTGFPEVKGKAREAELWGLLFAEVPFEAGAEVKIVWRMTGEGPLRASASLGGRRAKLVWLEEHGGSSWQRPGHEWGTGWIFPKPGCWKVELARTRGSGQVWLDVR